MIWFDFREIRGLLCASVACFGCRAWEECPAVENPIVLPAPNEEETYPAGRQRKFGRKNSSFGFRVGDHVVGGGEGQAEIRGENCARRRERIFKQVFGMKEGGVPQGLADSQCYLSTSAGPIAGLLFISTKKSKNVNSPAQKYVEMLTEDDYEFWFMGFSRYEKAFKNLEQAMTLANRM
ncbi:hypothetical protein ACJRO7_008039 [Eucalyptus globulus]|uniref:GRAM domain-containing protein n=1 Tax=Eucalyptus globulus TaxID=34317 RepID=A0ABD3IQ02_EUCGL